MPKQRFRVTVDREGRSLVLKKPGQFEDEDIITMDGRRGIYDDFYSTPEVAAFSFRGTNRRGQSITRISADRTKLVGVNGGKLGFVSDYDPKTRDFFRAAPEHGLEDIRLNNAGLPEILYKVCRQGEEEIWIPILEFEEWDHVKAEDKRVGGLHFKEVTKNGNDSFAIFLGNTAMPGRRRPKFTYEIERIQPNDLGELRLIGNVFVGCYGCPTGPSAGEGR